MECLPCSRFEFGIKKNNISTNQNLVEGQTHTLHCHTYKKMHVFYRSQYRCGIGNMHYAEQRYIIMSRSKLSEFKSWLCMWIWASWLVSLCLSSSYTLLSTHISHTHHTHTYLTHSHALSPQNTLHMHTYHTHTPLPHTPHIYRHPSYI